MKYYIYMRNITCKKVDLWWLREYLLERKCEEIKLFVRVEQEREKYSDNIIIIVNHLQK